MFRSSETLRQNCWWLAGWFPKIYVSCTSWRASLGARPEAHAKTCFHLKQNPDFAEGGSALKHSRILRKTHAQSHFSHLDALVTARAEDRHCKLRGEKGLNSLAELGHDTLLLFSMARSEKRKCFGSADHEAWGWILLCRTRRADTKGKRN